MAGYCVEALMDSRPLMTSALVPSTAKEAGRKDADERAEFYVVPHEQLVFSRMNVGNLSACSVFLQDGAEGWSIASVSAHMKTLGLVAAPECAKDGTEFWFSQLPNLKRRGVTAVADVSDDVVLEILAFETPEISRPSDCLAQAS